MIAAQHRILEVRKTPRKTDDSYRSTIAELPGLFTAGFTLSYLKGFLSTLATVELPPLLDNALLLAGLSFLILHSSCLWLLATFYQVTALLSLPA